MMEPFYRPIVAVDRGNSTSFDIAKHPITTLMLYLAKRPINRTNPCPQTLAKAIDHGRCCAFVVVLEI